MSPPKWHSEAPVVARPEDMHSYDDRLRCPEHSAQTQLKHADTNARPEHCGGLEVQAKLPPRRTCRRSGVRSRRPITQEVIGGAELSTGQWLEARHSKPEDIEIDSGATTSSDADRSPDSTDTGSSSS